MIRCGSVIEMKSGSKAKVLWKDILKNGWVCAGDSPVSTAPPLNVRMKILISCKNISENLIGRFPFVLREKKEKLFPTGTKLLAICCNFCFWNTWEEIFRGFAHSAQRIERIIIGGNFADSTSGLICWKRRDFSSEEKKENEEAHNCNLWRGWEYSHCWSRSNQNVRTDFKVRQVLGPDCRLCYNDRNRDFFHDLSRIVFNLF